MVTDCRDRDLGLAGAAGLPGRVAGRIVLDPRGHEAMGRAGALRPRVGLVRALGWTQLRAGAAVLTAPPLTLPLLQAALGRLLHEQLLLQGLEPPDVLGGGGVRGAGPGGQRGSGQEDQSGAPTDNRAREGVGHRNFPFERKGARPLRTIAADSNHGRRAGHDIIRAAGVPAKYRQRHAFPSGMGGVPPVPWGRNQGTPSVYPGSRES